MVQEQNTINKKSEDAGIRSQNKLVTGGLEGAVFRLSTNETNIIAPWLHRFVPFL